MTIEEVKDLGDQPMVRQTGVDTGVLGSGKDEVDPFEVAKMLTFDLR